MEKPNLSQDARRKQGHQHAAARRDDRRETEAARLASGTGPPPDPEIEPMQSQTAADNHTPNRKWDRSRATLETSEAVKLANADLGTDPL
ncbi:hypothetical protein [Nocardia crassostreae]|uniref:hypothetical protein n=1 Tax=Nocardia crassostreae TaxID=53428 RepID=UPI00082B93B6|nr:hypothetical protein [Nocardia crassostreae]